MLTRMHVIYPIYPKQNLKYRVVTFAKIDILLTFLLTYTTVLQIKILPLLVRLKKYSFSFKVTQFFLVLLKIPPKIKC